MFAALNQGHLVYILDKTTDIKFAIGEIVGITQPTQNTPFNNNNQQTINLKLKIKNQILEFNGIPSNSSLVSYDNGKYIISETKQGLQNEVEAILQNSQNIINNIDYYKNNITKCVEILKELNPQFAKDKERDERIDNLDDKVSSIQSTLEKLVTMISNNNPK